VQSSKKIKISHSDNRSPVVHHRVITTKTLLFVGYRLAIKGTLVTLCVALAAWLIHFGYNAFIHAYHSNPEYQLRLVQLNENTAMNESDLAKIVQIPLDGSIMAMDIAKMEKTLASRPEIISASVKRHLPGTLQFELEVRKPIAWVECLPKNFIAKKLEQGHLIDEQGILYPCPALQFDAAQSLPVIVVAREEAEELVIGKKVETKSARRALQLLSIAQNASQDSSTWVARISPYRTWGIVLTTTDGVEATFGLDDQERQMNDLQIALRHAKSLGQRLKSINLIPRKNLPVVLQNAQPQPLFR
jgi:cell division septal protein FtsQ